MRETVDPHDHDVERLVHDRWEQQAGAFRQLINTRLAEICRGFHTDVPALGLAMSEAVLAPGKRFRGVLMLMIAAKTGGIRADIVDAACAIELMHAASLVIDDLPAMDGATLRRGLPTTHVAHGEGRAVLAGIALVSEAFRILAVTPGPCAETRVSMVAILAGSIGPAGLCAGQDLDLHDAKTMQSLAREQDLKTGLLFAAGFRMIALLQGCDAGQSAALAAISGHLGRVFQSYDDLRDLSAKPHESGKTQGLDRSGAGPNKGLLAVADVGRAADHYRPLRATLDHELGGLWFDARALAGYIASVLPADPFAMLAAAD